MSTVYPKIIATALWKSPVEKPVEIVEKFEFSTGKSEICKINPPE